MIKRPLVVCMLTWTGAALAADLDRDGIDDSIDNCPGIANPDQLNSNADAFGDACVSPSTALPAGTVMEMGATVGASVTVGSGVTLAAYSRVNDGASLGANTFVGSRSTVGAGAQVGPDVVLGRRADVGIDAILDGDTLVGRAARIGARAHIESGVSLGYASVVAADADIGANAILGAFSSVGSFSDIAPGSALARGVIIGSGTTIGDRPSGSQTVLGPEVHVGDNVDIDAGVRIRKLARIDGSTHVYAGARIGRDARVGREANIGANATLRALVQVSCGGTVDADTTIARGQIVDGTCSADGTFPDTATLNTVWYISPSGDDATGDGSSGNPFQDFYTAQALSQSGDGIYLMPGTHHFQPAVVDSFTSAAIHDDGKALQIWGANSATIVEAPASDVLAATSRDYNVFFLENGGTQVSNFTVHYSPNRGNNYGNAIFRNPAVGTRADNLWVINTSETHDWSYIYSNSIAGSPTVTNSVFDARGRSQNDYTGSPVWDNCLFSIAPSRGTFNNHLVRDVTNADLYADTAPSDLRDAEGAVSIGTAGGDYAWGICPGADSDGDGICDELDLCTGDDATGDSDKDGVCDELDQCQGTDASGDTDSDGVCDSSDLCPDTAAMQCGSLPDPADYTNTFYIAPYGDDDTGDGSVLAPFGTLPAAVDAAASGDAIVFMPGTHRLTPWQLDGYAHIGVFDDAKALHIWGANDRSVLEGFGADAVGLRDYNLFSLRNNSTVVSNLELHYSPNRGATYSNSIFRFSAATATVHNVYVINVGTYDWSYNYDNNNLGGPLVYNSVFASNGNSVLNNWTGTGQWRSVLWDARPNAGTIVGDVIRTPNAPTDLFESTIPADLQNAGDPSVLNNDNSTSHVGTAGGLYPWE